MKWRGVFEPVEIKAGIQMLSHGPMRIHISEQDEKKDEGRAARMKESSSVTSSKVKLSLFHLWTIHDD